MMEQREKAGIKNGMQECVSGADRKDSDIMVSICCITYNQASYIRDALEGFVNQKTDFAYEVLIHDDASTDGTADIIREYADRYPDLIFPILQTENQYSKGLTNVSGTFNFPRARGKYIAMCEGDDYWTDDRKLQKQVDYLEANPGCSLCFHSAKVEVQGKALTEHAMRPYKGSRMVSPEEIIDKTSGYPTASLMFYREMVADLPDKKDSAEPHRFRILSASCDNRCQKPSHPAWPYSSLLQAPASSENRSGRWYPQNKSYPSCAPFGTVQR